MSKVVIIDYQLSNLHSVKRALEYSNMTAKISSNKEEILNSDLVILPGVGAFKEAMTKLTDLDLISTIHNYISLGKPFVGICLGMQLLFEESNEFGSHKGLGLIEGSVKKFIKSDIFKVPHIGWNKIEETENKFDKKIINFNSNKNFMYFVHSCYVIPKFEDIILSYTHYNNMKFCSSINHKNIFAFQFHPEKSGNRGLEIYNNIKRLLDE